jgi:hypothetical protein
LIHKDSCPTVSRDMIGAGGRNGSLIGAHPEGQDAQHDF